RKWECDQDAYGETIAACMIENHQPAVSNKRLAVKKKGKAARRLGNCSENPNCLYGLGEYTEGIWKSVPELLKALGEDPSLSIRTEINQEKSTPCGLRNLGATCYVNSMVQVLFMDLAFRRAVHEWEPSESNKVDAARLGQMQALQRLFAFLQFSASSYVDPQEFSNTLNLDESIQQDAHEFTKLLLSHLQSIFVFSKHKPHWNFINSHFRGNMKYVTMCQRCKTETSSTGSYYDLSLNIRGHTTIQDSFQQSFTAPEFLEGDNRYFCTACDAKQNATRSIQLESMPPVLTLHLMRFVYDMKTMTRRKVQDAIEINSVLTVSSDIKYRLVAVLNHTGTTAHAGHYTATIYCPDVHEWFTFNDTEVTKAKVGNTISSKEAYMLIYSRMDSVIAIVPAEEIPYANDVEDCNRQLYQDIGLWNSQINSLTQKIEERQVVYKKYFETSDPCSFGEESNYYWVATDYLKYWIQGRDIEQIPFVLEVASYKCEHGRLSPEYARCHFKRISPQLFEVIAPPSFAVVSSENFRCNECAQSWHSEHLESQSMQQELLEQLGHLDYDYSTDSESFLISRKWITSWKVVATYTLTNSTLSAKKLAESQSTIEMPINADILCGHSNLQPNKKKQHRAISPLLWLYLKQHYSVAKELLFKTTKECSKCVCEANQMQKFQLQAQAHRDRILKSNAILRKLFKRRMMHPFENIFEIPLNEPFAIIDRGWITQWKDYFEDMDASEPSSLGLGSFECEHGKFIVPHNVKECMLATTMPKERKEEGEIVTLDEWEQLENLYGSNAKPLCVMKISYDNIIYGFIKDDGTLKQVEICSKCDDRREEKHINFHAEPISVVLLRKDQPVPIDDESQLEMQNPRRRSTRAGRNANTQYMIECNADDTIGLFKHKILEHADISPNHQVLYFNGDILNNNRTLKDIGIHPRDTIYLQAMADAMEDNEPIEILDSNDREEGFRFTAFSAPESSSTVWVCSLCTYVNDPTDLVCDMCDASKE
ncbi:ubiquitin-specific protease, partial [Thraustotheca clavata]